MLDDSSSDEEQTPSSFSEASSLEGDSHRVIVLRHLKPARSAASSPGVRPPGTGHPAKSNSAPPLGDFLHSRRIGPITIFNKRRRLKEELRRREDISSYSTENGKAWLSYRTVGGLRQDPFNSLPVEPRDCIPNAIDHFAQTFIPERILRPFSAVPGIQNLAHDYFQLVINDVCVFEATVAQSQASFVAQQGIRRPTKEVLHHHGKALIHLQEKLADPVLSMEDATIHAILAIMGTHFFFGELDAHQSHLDGLWSLIRMRGGIETLGWHGTLRQAVETVSSFVAYSAKHESPAASPELVQESARQLDYPDHPFPAELSESIAKLPEGFGEVALKRNLSLQMINLLVDLHEQTLAQRNQPCPPERQPQNHVYAADKCIALLKSRGMPDLERMICSGLLAYTISSQPAPTRTRIYDEALQQLLTELAQYTYFNYENDSLLWTTFCFAALQTHLFSDQPHFFHHTIMRFKVSSKWERLEAALKRFLWTEERMEEWHERWEECVQSHRPDGRRQSREPTPATSNSTGASGKTDSPD